MDINKELLAKLCALASAGRANREKSIPYLAEKILMVLNHHDFPLDGPNTIFHRQLMAWIDKIE